MIKKFLILIGLVFLAIPSVASARDTSPLTDWYLQDFQSEIIVNQDSSIDVTERITADCGNLPGKHGIFRVLPTQYQYSSNQAIKTPVKLQSITDFQGKSIPYQQSASSINHTLTWKIGDPDQTVTGVNFYQIKYKVQNVVRFKNSQFDEFYWNLNGNFWDIETDHFLAKISYPTSVKNEAQTSIYSGPYGTRDLGLARFQWTSDNTLQVESTDTLKAGEGITVSTTVPKGIFTSYTPSFGEKYGQYFFLILPLFFLILCLSLWSKYGRDPKIVGPVVQEFGPPEDLTPMEMGTLVAGGKLAGQSISAGIVNLAVHGNLKIEQISKKNYQLALTDKSMANLSDSEKLLLDKLFEGQKQVETDDLKNKFYAHIPTIQKNIIDKLKSQGLYQPTGWGAPILFIGLSFVCFGLIFIVFPLGPLAVLSLILSIIILIVFTVLMPHRTIKGAQTIKKIEGFKLYMKTAERYRQEFNEKENNLPGGSQVFEKFLPFAMVFGIVGLWTKAFAKIYGELHHQDYFATYHPIWFMATGSGTFNPDVFTSSLESLTANMASTISSSPSSSGAGGGGFSGGGGGGGGGGGW